MQWRIRLLLFCYFFKFFQTAAKSFPHYLMARSTAKRDAFILDANSFEDVNDAVFSSRSIRLYFEYYQLPLIFIIIPFFAISITNGESTFYSLLLSYFFCGMKLQFSENIKTIIKIQRFSIEWQSALNSFLLPSSLFSVLKFKRKSSIK